MSYPNIQAERARRGLTKEGLAKELGVSYRTLYNWERYGQYPLEALQKMSKMFGCSIDYLVQPITKEEKA